MEGRQLGGLAGGEAESGEAPAAPLVHFGHQALDAVPAVSNGGRRPRPGGQHHERVVHTGVEARRRGEDVVAMFHRSPEAPSELRLRRRPGLEMGHAEPTWRGSAGHARGAPPPGTRAGPAPPARMAPRQRASSASPRTSVRTPSSMTAWPWARAQAGRWTLSWGSRPLTPRVAPGVRPARARSTRTWAPRSKPRSSR